MDKIGKKPTNAIMRRLGASEAYATGLQMKAAGTLLVVGAFGFPERIAPDTLKRTLAALMVRFPLLRATVSHDADGYPVFVDSLTVDDVPIAVKAADGADTWSCVFDDELQKPLDHARGLWRVVLIDGAEGSEQSWLLVAMDHAITDGTSWVAFAGAFDRFHAAGRSGPIGGESPGAVLAPAEQRLAASGFTPARAVKPVTDEPWRHAEAAALSERRTRYLHTVIEASAITALIARCHARKVTITDIMLAALARALAGLAGTPDRFVITVPHNVRDVPEPPIDHGEMGLYVVEISVVCERRPCLDSDPWTLAADLATQVRAGVEPSMMVDPDYDPKAVDGAIAREADGARRTFSKVVLSNLGVQKITRGADGLDVDQCYIGVSQRSGDTAFFVTAMTIDGALNVSIGACQPLISIADHNSVAERFLTTLTA